MNGAQTAIMLCNALTYLFIKDEKKLSGLWQEGGESLNVGTQVTAIMNKQLNHGSRPIAIDHKE